MGSSNNPASKFQSKSFGVTKMFTGMSPLLLEDSVDQAIPMLRNQGKDWDREFLTKQMNQLQEMAGPKEKQLRFDSSFESGNLDMAI